MNRPAFPEQRSNLGLVAVGNSRWTAGTIYTQNLARSLRLLPEEERGKVILLRGPSSNDQDSSILRPDIDHSLRFDYRRNSTARRRILRIGYALARRRWPLSLEGQCQSVDVRAVFPVCSAWPGDRSVTSMTWIPDFQHCHYPEFFPAKEARARDSAFQHLIDCGAVVVISSADARKDLFRHFTADEKKVLTLPFVSMASSDWYLGDPQAVARQYDLPERYLMFPSQFWIHKNHETLFRAVAIARDRGLADFCLVCTGQTQDYRHPMHFERLQSWIREHRLEAQIRILGLLPRLEQVHLMRRAAAIVQPSLFEGWSAIVEDDRTLGKRMLISDIPVHREQDPPRCQYFDPADPDELATKIARLWPELSAGPNLDEEANAYDEHLHRGLSFARRFLAAVDLAASRSRSCEPRNELLETTLIPASPT